MTSLCKSHITALRKISVKLAYKLTMNGGQLVLGKKNKKLIEKAESQIYDLIFTLKKIE